MSRSLEQEWEQDQEKKFQKNVIEAKKIFAKIGPIDFRVLNDLRHR